MKKNLIQIVLFTGFSSIEEKRLIGTKLSDDAMQLDNYIFRFLDYHYVCRSLDPILGIWSYLVKKSH